jgi:ribonuclease HII
MGTLIVGIDEAGYAPVLGPLVVTATAFSAPDGACDLYKLLGPAVAPPASSAPEGAVVVGDSKVVYRSGKGLDALERGVLPFARLAHGECATDLALCRKLDAALDLDGLAWYAGIPQPLPADCQSADIDGCASRIERLATQRGVRFEMMRSRVVTARDLNAMLGRGMNKAEALADTVAGLLREAVPPCADGAEVLVDRLGGRKFYAPLLERAFEGASIGVECELAEESRYRVTLASGARVAVAFAVRAEGKCLAVALASMTGKYVRELLMRRLNRFFRDRCRGLSPTAGYPVDGARFLMETSAVRARLGIADGDLVRSR